MRKTFLFFMLTLPLFVLAQNSVNASGGEAIGSGGTASFSIGQPFYQSYASASGNIQQGVQQAYAIISTSVELPDVEWSVKYKIYPNPSSDFIHIEINDTSPYMLQLFSLEGKLIHEEYVSAQLKQLNMQDYPIATYLLKMKNESGKIKSFKIIKK